MYDIVVLVITLNPEQQKAVETTEGPLLIVAGAGAGKTRRPLPNESYTLLKKVLSQRKFLP